MVVYGVAINFLKKILILQPARCDIKIDLTFARNKALDMQIRKFDLMTQNFAGYSQLRYKTVKETL